MIALPRAPWEDELAWVEPSYSRNRVNRAGKIVLESSDPAELDEARKVLSNWRSAHGYPLHVLTTTLRNRATAVTRRSLVVQRLKRLVSMENKLLRRPETRATQIQDVGGCRAVVPSMRYVTTLVGKYRTGRSTVS